MNIKDILDSLGLDLTNPEVKRGAAEAIEAILASRQPMPSSGMSGGEGQGGNTVDLDIDPDLLQPSVKQKPTGLDDADIEVEDDEHILDQVKHNESEEPTESSGISGDDSDAGQDSTNSEGTEDNTTTSTQSAIKSTDTNDSTAQDNELTGTAEDEEASASDSEEIDTATTETEDSEEEASESHDDADTDFDKPGDLVDFDDVDDEAVADEETTATEGEVAEDDEVESTKNDEEEFEFDEDDLIDDELKNSVEDEEIKTKHNARKVKRERTLAAAKKALIDAQAKKIAPALIRELESAIAALEALTEAVTKSIQDISDAEFNQLVNRVFDAIQACGESDLTFTSEEEREAKVKEIKDDIASAQTQAELSAEDAAKIRAEVQATKARDKEADKYKQRPRSSFKGFQEFLNSLYRAIALQVHNEEIRDDSWSAISRRNSGAGVLQQGKKINDLPNKKIPVIDFYFDQSGSWGEDDILVGEKAVQSLAEMEANGQIKINIYYFSNDVFSDAASARAQGGTAAWNEIVKNVIATQATNVIIMTDGDMERWWRPQKSPALKYTVPGYVWYLWRDGENAPRLPRDLKGRGGVQQFSFSANDV